MGSRMAGRGADSRKLIPLILFITVSAIACLTVMRSDWMRYTAHLIPLCIIAGVYVMPRRWYLALPIIMLMGYQTCGSVLWMRSRVAQVAPVQEQRIAIGGYLRDNVYKYEWILSSDIGAIGYYAHRHQFVDLNMLVSKTTIDQVRPNYLADTFAITGNSLQYMHPAAQTYLNTKRMNIERVKQATPNIAIAVVELTENYQ